MSVESINIPENWKNKKFKEGKKLIITPTEKDYKDIDNFVICTIISNEDDKVIIQISDINDNNEQKKIFNFDPNAPSKHELFKLDRNILTDKSGNIIYHYDLYLYYTKKYNPGQFFESDTVCKSQKEYVFMTYLFDIIPIYNTKDNNDINILIKLLSNKINPFSIQSDSILKIGKELLFKNIGYFINNMNETNDNINSYLIDQYDNNLKKCLIWYKLFETPINSLEKKFCSCVDCLRVNKTILESYTTEFSNLETNPEIIFISQVMIPEYQNLIDSSSSEDIVTERISIPPNILDFISRVFNNDDLMAAMEISMTEEQKRPIADKKDIDNLLVEKWNSNKHCDTCLLCQTKFKDMNNPEIIQCGCCQQCFCAGCNVNESKDENTDVDCYGLYRWFKEADVCPHCNSNIKKMVVKKPKN